MNYKLLEVDMDIQLTDMDVPVQVVYLYDTVDCTFEISEVYMYTPTGLLDISDEFRAAYCDDMHEYMMDKFMEQFPNGTWQTVQSREMAAA